MKRIVLDTSVIVSALRSKSGASNALLRLVAYQTIVPMVSPALFLEYEDVLKRPEQRLITGLTEQHIDQFLSAFASAAEPVDINFQWRPQLRDPADEMVLEVAVNARAEALVTHNIRDFLPAAYYFGLNVIQPYELLRIYSHD
jgi:putative PIN family toxin of toxin-antitoxin system